MMPWWKSPYLYIIVTQILFTISDLIGRSAMKEKGFTLSSFLGGWFLLYLLIRQIATMGQLYVFANIELGKTMALFGAASIVLSNILSFLVLKETLNVPTYIGISLSIIAFLVLAWWPEIKSE